MIKEPKILFYDIETAPLQAWIWKTGEQYIRHGQLVAGYDEYNIICIAYAWDDDKPAKVMKWDVETQDCSSLIERFDAIVKQADVIIGKNSDRFDNKHINTQRWLKSLPPFPDWVDCRDDVEKQLRKYFILPSYSLDYVSQQLGLGGKDKMEFQDWIDIMERNDKKKLAKMMEYNKKDVEDTRAVYRSIKPYIKPKFSMATWLNDFVCVGCGSSRLSKNGTRVSGKTRYQRYLCQDCGMSAKAPLNKNNEPGKIGA